MWISNHLLDKQIVNLRRRVEDTLRKLQMNAGGVSLLIKCADVIGVKVQGKLRDNIK